MMEEKTVGPMNPIFLALLILSSALVSPEALANPIGDTLLDDGVYSVPPKDNSGYTFPGKLTGPSMLTRFRTSAVIPFLDHVERDSGVRGVQAYNDFRLSVMEQVERRWPKTNTHVVLCLLVKSDGKLSSLQIAKSGGVKADRDMAYIVQTIHFLNISKTLIIEKTDVPLLFGTDEFARLPQQQAARDSRRNNN